MNLKIEYNHNDKTAYIQSKDMIFSYVANMYDGGRAGLGMQVNEKIDVEKAEVMCMQIIAAIEQYYGDKP